MEFLTNVQFSLVEASSWKEFRLKLKEKADGRKL